MERKIERELAKLAGLVAAGVVAEDQLLSMLGSETLVNKVLAMAGTTVVTGAAKGAIEDAVDTAMDVVDSINPLKLL